MLLLKIVAAAIQKRIAVHPLAWLFDFLPSSPSSALLILWACAIPGNQNVNLLTSVYRGLVKLAGNRPFSPLVSR